MQAPGFAEQATKRLFTGVNPTRRPVLHELPRDFFIENRKNVTFERINENMILVHDGRTEEREKHIYTTPSSDKDGKQFALLKKQEEREAADRRLVVQNCMDPPYSAFCFLRIIYNLTDRISSNLLWNWLP